MPRAVLTLNSMGVSQLRMRADRSHTWQEDDYLWMGVYRLKFDTFRLPLLACVHCDTAESGEEDRALWRNRLSQAMCEAIESGQTTAFGACHRLCKSGRQLSTLGAVQHRHR